MDDELKDVLGRLTEALGTLVGVPGPAFLQLAAASRSPRTLETVGDLSPLVGGILVRLIGMEVDVPA